VGKLKVAASYGGDVQERKIRKSGAAEARVYADMPVSSRPGPPPPAAAAVAVRELETFRVTVAEAICPVICHSGHFSRRILHAAGEVRLN
jgi:hypothetical protein